MSTDSQRVVVTGYGIVTGAGGDVTAIWDKIVAGETAVAPIEQWDIEGWPASVAAEVKMSNRELVPERKLHKSISRTDLLGIYAADQAINGSGLLAVREALDEKDAATFSDRSGILAGSGGASYNSNYDFFPVMVEADGALPEFGKELENMVTPMWLLKNLPNNVLCHAGIRHLFKGTNGCITNQCLSGLQAVSESVEAIRVGEADRMAAVGHDAPLEPENVTYFHSHNLMSTEVPRPFDAARSGTVFGEAAAALVLEKRDEAESRGASVFGEILGAGCAGEAAGILEISDDGDGVTRAIRGALDDAGISADEIGMICAHANGTERSDLSEARGIRAAFGSDSAIPPVTGFKWAYGHSIAASGIVDLLLTMRALQENVVPGIATLSELASELNGFPVSQHAQTPRSNIGLVLCRGFGGMNLAVLVKGGSAA